MRIAFVRLTSGFGHLMAVETSSRPSQKHSTSGRGLPILAERVAHKEKPHRVCSRATVVLRDCNGPSVSPCSCIHSSYTSVTQQHPVAGNLLTASQAGRKKGFRNRQGIPMVLRHAAEQPPALRVRHLHLRSRSDARHCPACPAFCRHCFVADPEARPGCEGSTQYACEEWTSRASKVFLSQRLSKDGLDEAPLHTAQRRRRATQPITDRLTLCGPSDPRDVAEVRSARAPAV